MLREWIYWLSAQTPHELLWILAGLLLIDGPRYAILTAVMVQWDALKELANLGRLPRKDACSSACYCPSVSVLLVGHNEADTIYATLDSVWGSCPKMDIIVVDDGSTDGMATEVRRFQQTHGDILLLSRPERGGKTSGLNWALHHATAEVVVTVDADCRLAPDGIREIVQPLSDSRVGAVSGSVRVWNQDVNLLTRLQAYEYRQTILVGRALQARFHLLGIVSGAFGAFRRDALQQIRGWDVGPGEDGDLVLRLRRSGYAIRSAPAAECHTNVPETVARLARQRRRWDRTVVTFETRKYASAACFWGTGFRGADFLFTLDRWFFNIVCVFVFWAYAVWLAIAHFNQLGNLLALLYVCQVACELVQYISLFWFSRSPLKDLRLFTAVGLMPFYYTFLKLVDLVALVEEFVFRASGRDNFVPEKVRLATWRW